jgi:hypothetical protein
LRISTGGSIQAVMEDEPRGNRRVGEAMTLQIELTAEQEARLAAAARQRGVAPAELAQELLTEHLPQIVSVNAENSGSRKRDPELAARVRSIRGKYAHVGATTEDLHRERQAERQQDERQRRDGR